MVFQSVQLTPSLPITTTGEESWKSIARHHSEPPRYVRRGMPNLSTKPAKLAVVKSKGITIPLPQFTFTLTEKEKQHPSKPRQRKRSKNKSSGYRGVSKCAKDGRWQARIRVGKSVKYLGRFRTEPEAAMCYDEAARAYHGPRAIVNFPDTVIVPANREEQQDCDNDSVASPYSSPPRTPDNVEMEYTLKQSYPVSCNSSVVSSSDETENFRQPRSHSPRENNSTQVYCQGNTSQLISSQRVQFAEFGEQHVANVQQQQGHQHVLHHPVPMHINMKQLQHSMFQLPSVNQIKPQPHSRLSPTPPLTQFQSLHQPTFAPPATRELPEFDAVNGLMSLRSSQ